MRPLPPLPVALSKSWSLVKPVPSGSGQPVGGANEYTVPRVEAAPLEVVPPELVVP